MLKTETDQASQSEAIVQLLQQPTAYAERPKQVQTIETHISWVFLTERYAYKLKKPVSFDFLDFSTAELREQACREELRLNRRLAPDVYIDVAPISPDQFGRLRLGGKGTPIDWVVKMRRLSAEHSLDKLIQTRQLRSSDIHVLARALVEFYGQLPPLTVRIDEYRQQLEQHIHANHHELLTSEYGFSVALLERLHEQQMRLLRLAPELLDDRVRDGRIVEGHGDLRPEHVYFESRPTIIDCVEFNSELRSLDVLDELAYLAMECDLLGAESIGKQIVSYYQQGSADHAPLEVFGFYKLYRACVRAKVLSLRSLQVAADIGQSLLEQAERYLQLATNYCNTLGPPLLVVVRGLPGSGKSTLARALTESLKIELLQTDAIRRELFKPPLDDAGYGEQHYNPRAREQVYQEMFRRASNLLDARQSVVLDGTFLSTEQRRRAVKLALKHDSKPLIVRCTCPKDVSLGRIVTRQASGTSLSEARPDFFDKQEQAEEPDPSGLPVLTVNTTEGLPTLQRYVFTRLRSLLA